MKKFSRALILLILLLGLFPPGSHILAENTRPEREPDPERKLDSFFPNLWEEQKDIWSASFRPSTWENPSSWIFAGAVAGSFTLDKGFSRNLRENDSFNDFNKIIASDGMKWIVWAYPLATLAAAKISGSQSGEEYGWKLSEGAVNAFLVSKALKLAAGRERPHTGKIYGFREGGNSFPSGHSIIAWTLAEVSVQHFTDRKWVPWVAYPIAGIISFSRITSGNHFTSDAVAGSLIGFSIGHWTIR